MLAEEILVVNDGSSLLQMLGGLLKNKGYHLSLTDSPEEALELLATRNIVLVVLKLDGQQTDRLAVMHMVKELNGGTRLVIVGESSQLPVEIFEVEADDYILLPCRIADIWRRLSICLESPALQAAVLQEDGLMHPINQRVFHNLGLLFHDMRGLLTSISEGMRLLERKLEGRVGEEAEGIFQQTYRKTRILLDLSNDFLQKFRPATVPDQVDLRQDVIDPVVQEFGEELQNHHITLVNRLTLPPPAHQKIRGDRAALKSVFRNLLHNAITHGGRGCTIVIDLDENPRHFRLQVHNSGEPIPPGRQKVLFSGVRRDRADDRGAGLGLHLGREVMRSLGGDVSYESGGQGANFILTVPRV